MMFKKIKSYIKVLIITAIKLLSRTSLGQFLSKNIALEAMDKTITINHKGQSLTFSAPNTLNIYRANSFSSKEPETLEWIDAFEEGSVFWDVGANVGLYSCYAAARRNCKVIAFEPSVFNLELLARNIVNNDQVNNISILPLAISNKEAQSLISLTTKEWGGALSTFGETYGQDGKELKVDFAYGTYGLRLDSVVDFFQLKPPRYLKIDVDGIEHLILEGGSRVLADIEEVLIEINEGFLEQSSISTKILTEHGFALAVRGDAVLVEDSQSDQICNQIWVKEQ